MERELGMKSIRKQHINIVLWISSILTVIKSIFTEYGYDSSYHIAMSWRHINGDRLFGEMWEPHQTSAFALDLLMLIYRFFIPSMTGVALFLQITGAVIYLLIVLLFYKYISRFVDKRVTTIGCSFFWQLRDRKG